MIQCLIFATDLFKVFLLFRLIFECHHKTNYYIYICINFVNLFNLNLKILHLLISFLYKLKSKRAVEFNK